MSEENRILSPYQQMRTPDATATLFSRLAQAVHEADEAKIRAELTAKVREAMENSDYWHTCDFGLSDEDWDTLATAAVDALADYYRAQLDRTKE